MSLPQTSPSVGLTHLDRADLVVLDLGLSYLTDALREDPDVLPDAAERVALRDLHRQVLDLKLVNSEEPSEPSATQTFWRSPSGRVHSLRGCSGGPGPHRMRRVELTRTEFEARQLYGDDTSRQRCRCATWKETT